jgi:hypothetical protein
MFGKEDSRMTQATNLSFFLWGPHPLFGIRIGCALNKSACSQHPKQTNLAPHSNKSINKQKKAK